MNVTKRTITVRWRVAGFHFWPDAHGERLYPGSKHRHVFHIELSMDVAHDDREVEFHDLLACGQRSLGGSGTLGNPIDFQHASCEQIALLVLVFVEETWPGRPMKCSVFEDGECGATMEVTP